MVANVITSENPSLTNLFNKNNSFNLGVQEYLQQVQSEFMNKISNSFNAFKEKAINTFNYFSNNNTLIQSTIANMNQANHIYGDTVIYRVTEDNYRNTGYKMRQFIMAEPEINRLHSLNRISGYEDMYYNSDPNVVDRYKHIDYLRVIDGVNQFDEETGEMYFQFISTEEDRLTLREKLSIMDSWDSIKYMIANDIDPTELEE